MSKKVYFTKEGLEKLQKELSDLTNIERPKISLQIAEARDKGDLSENAEYDAAKDAQGMLELKIAKLQEVISNARIINETQMPTDEVRMFTKVTIKNLKNNTQLTYTLVSESEANLKESKISVTSPIGKGLLGKKVGEISTINAPAGVIQLQVIEINPM